MTAFATILADPPWAFSDSLPGRRRGAVRNYSTLPVRDILRFLQGIELADDARLFLWRPAAFAEEALAVCRAWGFVPKTEIVWNKTTKTGKPHFGMGHTVRASHETLLVGARGHPARLSNSVRSTFSAPYVGHSAKPEAIFELVERLSPGPYLELFARAERPGWTCLGNELGC